MTFGSWLCFHIGAKKAPNVVDLLDRAILSNGHQRSSNSLRYAPENRFSPRVVTGKWLLKNKKLTTSLKSTTWTNPQNKNNKKSHEFRLTRTYIFKILNAICEENCAS
jgi:hypothetical protein